jgi:hypothetical protein
VPTAYGPVGAGKSETGQVSAMPKMLSHKQKRNNFRRAELIRTRIGRADMTTVSCYLTESKTLFEGRALNFL